MKKMITAVAAATLMLGTAACSGEATNEASDGSLAGTWRGDPDTASSENGDSNFTLVGTEFTCNSCLPPYTATADGEWQEMDRPGMDEMMIEVVDDMTIKTAFRFEGRDLGSSTWTVGDDGSTMTQTFVNLDAEEQTEGTVILSRTEDGPEGSHAMSGGWTLSEYGEISEAALLTTYAVDGDTVTVSFNGGGWTATLGGDAVPIEGNESGVMVAIESTGDNAYRETYTRGEDVVNVSEITIDGDTMSVVSTDPRDDSVFRYSASRQ